MESVYQIVTKPGTDAYRTYAKAHIKSHSGRRPVVSITVGVVLVAVALIPWLRYGFSLAHLFTLVIGLACLLTEPLALPILTKKLLRSLPAEPIRQDYRFFPDGFQLRYQGQKESKTYADIQQALESRDYFFLYMSRSMAFILPKADFTQGDPAAFASFLEDNQITLTQLPF